MSRYKLLALDLDDTVLTHNKKITAENKKWILKAMKAGVIVSLATGRGRPRVKEYIQELQFVGPMVLLNGAEVWNHPNRLLERHYLQHETVQQLYEKAKSIGAESWAYNCSSLIRFQTNDQNIPEDDWLKFGIKHNDQGILAKLRQELLENKSITVTSSSTHNLEISPKGVTKKSGVQRICEHFQLDMSDVMAIGDHLNDLPLLSSAGLGIAMGNACEETKKVSDHVTETNENHGVAKAIQKYLLI